MKKLRLIITSLVASLLLMISFSPALVLADCSDGNLTPKQALQCGTTGANGGNEQTSQDATTSFNAIVTDILNILTAVVGILAVVMIVLAGSRFVTSGGNQEKVASARRALTYAVIGIIIAAMAHLIATFVINRAVVAQNTTTTSGPPSGCDPNLGCH